MKKSKVIGRPPNDELMTRVVQELRKSPWTIKDLAEELDMPKRTAYRYINLAEEAGMTVVKLGFSKNAPYKIIDA